MGFFRFGYGAALALALAILLMVVSSLYFALANRSS
jgi:ABC-type sugar transport system permease subunit